MKGDSLENYIACLNKYIDVHIPPTLSLEDFNYLKVGCTSVSKLDYSSKKKFYVGLLQAAARGRIYGTHQNKFLLLTDLFATKIPQHEVQAIENTILINAQMSNISIKSH